MPVPKAGECRAPATPWKLFSNHNLPDLYMRPLASRIHPPELNHTEELKNSETPRVSETPPHLRAQAHSPTLAPEP